MGCFFPHQQQNKRTTTKIKKTEEKNGVESNEEKAENASSFWDSQNKKKICLYVFSIHSDKEFGNFNFGAIWKNAPTKRNQGPTTIKKNNNPPPPLPLSLPLPTPLSPTQQQTTKSPSSQPLSCPIFLHPPPMLLQPTLLPPHKMPLRFGRRLTL